MRTVVKQVDLIQRTRSFALRVIKLAENLPKNKAADILGRQILKSGTSVGANYRASCKARSKAEFIAKLHIVLEEADETLYWLELISDSGLMKKELLTSLMKEANEIIAIIASSLKTAKK